MAKFNNVLVTGYRQQQEQKKKQNELKSKHHIDDPNVVVVEKKQHGKVHGQNSYNCFKDSCQYSSRAACYHWHFSFNIPRNTYRLIRNLERYNR